MKWSDLAPVWQACLEEAWQAFLHGSVPVGAVVTDERGAILTRGRNHIFDDHSPAGQVSRNQLAHAEINALLHFDRYKHDREACSIYTSMEPCPLCMGAIYMMGIGRVYFAARDAYAGGTDMLGATPYLSKKEVRIHGPFDPQVENAAIALMVAFDCQRQEMPFNRRIKEALAAWETVCPKGVALGRRVVEENFLPWRTANERTAEEEFNLLFAEL